MNINKSNYEAWLLDYFEGALDANQVGELLLFAQQYPELDIDLEEDLDELGLSPDAIAFAPKDDLKKNTSKELVTAANYEDFLVAEMEGLLSSEEQTALDAYIKQHPELEKERAIYARLALQPEALNYTAKNGLKKDVATVQITSSNYEDFLVAEMEGLLSSEEQTALDAYIKQHPELEKERAIYARLALQPEALNYTAKNDLKKDVVTVQITSSNCEEFLIAEREGVLSKEEHTALIAYVQQHPEMVQDRAAYARVALEPDLSIVFANKKGLKKKRALVIPLFVRLAAAAAVALLILFFWPEPKDDGYEGLANTLPPATIHNGVEKTTESTESNTQAAFLADAEEAGSVLIEKDLIKNDGPVDPLKNTGAPSQVNTDGEGGIGSSYVASSVSDVPVKENFTSHRIPEGIPRPAVLVNTNTAFGVAAVLMPVDSAIKIDEAMMQQASETAVAVVHASQVPDENLLNVWQYVGMKIKTGLLDQDDVADGTLRENDVAQAVSKGIDKVTTKDLKFKDRTKEKRTSYGFQIGKIGFSRSASKK